MAAEQTGQLVGGVAGGVAGSAFGPAGTVAGGFLGAGIGGMLGNALGGDGSNAHMFDPSSYNEAATLGGVDPQAMAQQDAVMQQQGQLNSALAARALGTGGPSVAQQQLQQGLAATQGQALTSAANMRGGSAGQAAASQAAMQTNQQLGQQANQQAATLRAQEQIAAQQQLGQNYGQLAQENFQGANANLGANVQNSQINSGMANAAVGADANAYGAQKQANSSMLGGLMGGGASILGGIL